MICNKPFLLSVGDFSHSSFQRGSIAVSKLFDSDLIEISCEQPPISEFHDLVKRNEIVKLSGDAAIAHPSGGTWLDLLGAWKQPVVLMVEPLKSGQIPGSANAYTSLCKTLSVPLVGLIQLGGVWDSNLRKRDCLPWCGHLPDEFLNDNFVWDCESRDPLISLENLKLTLKNRLSFLEV